MSSPGKIIIIAGPSGAGKTTVLKELLERSPILLNRSISATTRPPREGEKEGTDYQFLSVDQFHELREVGHFLESFEVHGRGYWYGTPKGPIATSLEEGKWVLLEIDVQGTEEVVRQFPGAITIFLVPESFEHLERRLRSRGTESEEELLTRLKTARTEWEYQNQFQHIVVNDSEGGAVGRAVDDIIKILQLNSEQES